MWKENFIDESHSITNMISFIDKHNIGTAVHQTCWIFSYFVWSDKICPILPALCVTFHSRHESKQHNQDRTPLQTRHKSGTSYKLLHLVTLFLPSTYTLCTETIWTQQAIRYGNCQHSGMMVSKIYLGSTVHIHWKIWTIKCLNTYMTYKNPIFQFRKAHFSYQSRVSSQGNNVFGINI